MSANDDANDELSDLGEVSDLVDDDDTDVASVSVLVCDSLSGDKMLLKRFLASLRC